MTQINEKIEILSKQPLALALRNSLQITYALDTG